MDLFSWMQILPNFVWTYFCGWQICHRTCAYQGVRNVCFLENLPCFFFLATSVLSLAILPYHQRSGRKNMHHQWVKVSDHFVTSCIKWLRVARAINHENWDKNSIPADIYLSKVNNRSTRTRCEIYSKLTRKTPEGRHVLVSFLLTLNIFHTLL